MELKSKRVFFALVPNKVTTYALIDTINQIQNTSSYSALNWVKYENLHLTLGFIGHVDPTTINCLIKNAKAIKFNPFKFELNTTGIFKKPKALWLGINKVDTNRFDTDKISHPLQQLAQQISHVANACQETLQLDTFTPHVTIARKFNDDFQPNNFSPIIWEAEYFCLMESVSTAEGVRYKIVHRF